MRKYTHIKPRGLKPDFSSIPDVFRSMPDRSVLCTRDTYKISKSMDFLFMSLLLRNWKTGGRYLDMFLNEKGEMVCALTDVSGSHYHPVTGDILDTDGYELKFKLNKSTVKRYFKHNFLGIRKIVMGKAEKERTIKINGAVVFSDGVPDDRKIIELNDTLKWKYESSNDISDNYMDHFFKYSEKTRVHKKNMAICPIDGPVRVIAGDFISPERTWKNLYGRHYKVFLCPCCLGLFGGYLASMN